MPVYSIALCRVITNLATDSGPRTIFINADGCCTFEFALSFKAVHRISRCKSGTNEVKNKDYENRMKNSNRNSILYNVIIM